MYKSLVLILLITFSCAAFAQHDHSAMSLALDDSSTHQQNDMSGPVNLVGQTLHRTTSGTTAEPLSTPSAMFMTNKWGWDWMFHANVFVNVQQQSGTRGYDKFFSTNWFMPMAQRDFGPGRFTMRFMSSLEPATVTGGYYPVLFQTGETANGKPIVDGQHPHDFLMEIAVIYDLKLGKDTLLSFYGAPVGDPAIGPSAYPHRSSASENPLAPLGHHLQDSTHIASNVVTVGVTHKNLRVEASGFHGREPDEHRWDLDTGEIDSWSTRFSVNLGSNWSTQYSIGDLKSPEELHPDSDTRRMTASVMYNRPLPRGNWSSTLLWGRNRDMHSGAVFNGYLAESTLRFRDHNLMWARFENVDRNSELLLGKAAPPPGFEEEPLARVQAYTVGLDREFDLIPAVSSAFGGQVSWYGVPDSLKGVYGQHPGGVAIFLRFRPKMHQ